MHAQRRRRLWTTALAFGGFALLTLALFRPSPTDLTATAPAAHGHSDDALMLVSALAHVSRALLHDPRTLFDAPIFHPLRYSLAYSDHMIGQAIVGLPIWLATENPLLEFNVLALGSYALGAIATFVCAQALGLGPAAATAAGLVFAFTPFRFRSPLWLQVLFTPFMPLALAAWFRFLAQPTRRRWAAWVLCWVAHGLMGMYLALEFSAVMSALVLAGLLGLLGPLDRSRRLGLVCGPIAAGLLVAPTLWPYVLLRGPQGHVRTGGIDTLPSFVLPAPGVFSGWLTGLTDPLHFGPGLGVWVLAAIGGAALAGDPGRIDGLSPRLVRRALALGLVVTLLLVFVPLRFQQMLPGFDMIRGTNRAFFVTLLFVALLVAWGVEWLATRPRFGRTLAAACVVVLALDVGTPPRERKRLPTAAEIPPAHRWLAALPDDTVVYEHVHGPEPIAIAMYLQTFHRKRLPIGYGGFASPGTVYLNNRLHRFPAPESLRLLRAVGAAYVLDHHASRARAEAAMATPPAGLDAVERFDKDVIFRVHPTSPPRTLAREVHPLSRAEWRIDATLAPDTLPALRDGDASTAWGGPVAFRSEPTITIDLGDVHAVAGIRCVPTSPADNGPPSARAESSSDGTHWAPLDGAFEPDSLRMLFDDPRRFRFWEMRFPTTTARFVRLTNRDAAFWGSPWRIAELDVLVDEPADGVAP